MNQTCPSPDTLSAWLDDELEARQAQVVREHLAECARCRECIFGWAGAVGSMLDESVTAADVHPMDGPWQRRFPAGAPQQAAMALEACLPDEILVAYCERELDTERTARAEQHMQSCDLCLLEVQRLTQLQVGVATETGVARRTPAWSGVAARVTQWVSGAQKWFASLGQIPVRPWPAVGAVATAALLALVVVRLLPSGPRVGDVQFRDVPAAPKTEVEVVADDTPGRAEPDDNAPIIVMLGRGVTVKRLDDVGQWVRVELPNGHRVWVRSDHLAAR